VAKTHAALGKIHKGAAPINIISDPRGPHRLAKHGKGGRPVQAGFLKGPIRLTGSSPESRLAANPHVVCHPHYSDDMLPRTRGAHKHGGGIGTVVTVPNTTHLSFSSPQPCGVLENLARL
jgi:hypothetical protein